MKTPDEIKQMMAAGDTAEADEALKELLAKEPDNLQAKMLYGTCRQLLGDEETFKRIHDELAPVMDAQQADSPTAGYLSDDSPTTDTEGSHEGRLSSELKLWQSYTKTYNDLSEVGMKTSAVTEIARTLYAAPSYYCCNGWVKMLKLSFVVACVLISLLLAWWLVKSF